MEVFDGWDDFFDVGDCDVCVGDDSCFLGVVFGGDECYCVGVGGDEVCVGYFYVCIFNEVVELFVGEYGEFFCGFEGFVGFECFVE